MSWSYGITPITPEDMLGILEKRVQQMTGLGDRAFLSLWSQRFLLQSPRAQKFITIRPVNFPVWQSVCDGSGFENPLTGYNAAITLTVYVHNSSDPETWSINLVRENVLSLTTLVNLAAASMQGYVPIVTVDDEELALVREPMRMADSGWRFGDATDGKGGPWSYATVDFECRFSAKLPELPDIVSPNII